MNISLAQTLAGACSLGALYNAGKAIADSDGSSPLKEESLFALPPSREFVLTDTPIDAELEASSIENACPYLPEDSKVTNKNATIEVISKMDLEEYISAIINANTQKAPTQLHYVVMAAALGTIAALILKTSDLNAQNQQMANSLARCNERQSSHNLHMIQPDVLKPVSSVFFARVSNALIGFHHDSPNDLEAHKKYLTSDQSGKCRFVPIINSKEEKQGFQKRCIDLSLTQGRPSTAELTFTHTSVNDRPLLFKNGTSPLHDVVNIKCSETLHQNLTHVEASIHCRGDINSFDVVYNARTSTSKFTPLNTIHYESNETITAESKLQDDQPVQIGKYTSTEKVNDRVHTTNDRFTTTEELEKMPLGIKDAFPALNQFIKTGSAQDLGAWLKKE